MPERPIKIQCAFVIRYRQRHTVFCKPHSHIKSHPNHTRPPARSLMRRSSRGVTPPNSSTPNPDALTSRARTTDRVAADAKPPSIAGALASAEAASVSSPPKRSRLMVAALPTPPPLHPHDFCAFVCVLFYTPTPTPALSLPLTPLFQLHVKSPAHSSSPPPTSRPAAAAAPAASAPQTPRLTKSLSFAEQLTENDPSPLVSSPRYSCMRRVASGGAPSSPRMRTVESFSHLIATAAPAAVDDEAIEPTVTPRSNRRSSSALSICTSSGGTADNGTEFHNSNFTVPPSPALRAPAAAPRFLTHRFLMPLFRRLQHPTRRQHPAQLAVYAPNPPL
jgi:hypothetical protein